jgi:DNA repair exonuclease SbcCD nuclease subunit
MKKPIGVFLTDTHLSDDTIDLNISLFKQVDRLAQKHNVELFHLGDIFTARKAQSQVVLNTFGEILDDLKSKINIIPGNHDKTSLSSNKSYLDSFKYYPKVNLVREYSFIDVKETRVHLFPYFEESGFLEKLKNVNISKRLNNIIGLHLSISGVKNNDASVVLNNINQDLFSNFDLVLIGHYHKRSELGDNMMYIGSAYQSNFGEDLQKGFLVLYDDLSFEFVQSEFPRYTTINIDLNTILTEELMDLHSIYQNSKDFVRFIITGKEEKRKAFDKTKYELVGIKIVFKDETIEAEIEKASKGEFINFNKSNIVSQFESFCEKEELNYQRGLTYINEIIL